MKKGSLLESELRSVSSHVNNLMETIVFEASITVRAQLSHTLRSAARSGFRFTVSVQNGVEIELHECIALRFEAYVHRFAFAFVNTSEARVVHH